MLSVDGRESPGLHPSRGTRTYSSCSWTTGSFWFQRAAALRREAMHQNACTGLQITELSLRNNRLDWISHPFLGMLINLGCLDLTGSQKGPGLKRGGLSATAITMSLSPERVNARLYLKASPFNLGEADRDLPWLDWDRLHPRASGCQRTRHYDA